MACSKISKKMVKKRVIADEPSLDSPVKQKPKLDTTDTTNKSAKIKVKKKLKVIKSDAEKMKNVTTEKSQSHVHVVASEGSEITSESQPAHIEVLFLLKDAQTAEKGLQLFLEKAEVATRDYDIVVEFCMHSRSCMWVVALLKEATIPQELIFQVLECVLIRISSDLPKFTKLGASVSRELCTSHMPMLIAALNLTSKNVKIKSALKLLAAMVTIDDHSATEVVGYLKDMTANLTRLLGRKDMGDPQDIRACATLFVASFFITNNTLVINQTVECQNVIAVLFQTIHVDELDNVQLILSTVINKVLLNDSIKKTTKLHLVRCITWERVSDLFYWGGKRPWNFNNPVTDNTPFEQSEEQSEIAEQTQKFVELLCTSSHYGVMFNDYTNGTTDSFKNPMVLKILGALRYTKNERVQKTIMTILQKCPDVIRPFLAKVVASTVTLPYSFIHQIYSNQPTTPSCLKFCQGVSIQELCQRILVIILPQASVMSVLSAKFMSDDITVRTQILQIYSLSLSRVQTTISDIYQKRHELGIYRDSERKELEELLLRRFRAVFPNVKRVVTVIKSFVDILQKQSDGKDAKLYTEHLMKLQQFVTLYRGVLYPQTPMNLVYSPLTDAVKILQTLPISEEAGEEDSKNKLLLQLHMMNIIANDPSSHELVFSHETGQGEALIGRLLDQLVDLSSHPQLFSIGKHLISKICLSTGLFNDQPSEINIWLSPLSDIADHPKRAAIVRFVSRTFSRFVTNPVVYQNAVSEHVRECGNYNIAGKLIADERKENVESNVENILAMDEWEVRTDKNESVTENLSRMDTNMDDVMKKEVRLNTRKRKGDVNRESENESKIRTDKEKRKVDLSRESENDSESRKDNKKWKGNVSKESTDVLDSINDTVTDPNLYEQTSDILNKVKSNIEKIVDGNLDKEKSDLSDECDTGISNNEGEFSFSPLIMVALSGLLKLEVKYEDIDAYFSQVLMGVLHLQKEPKAFCSLVKKFAPELLNCVWLPYIRSWIPRDKTFKLDKFLGVYDGIKNNALFSLIRVHLKILKLAKRSDILAYKPTNEIPAIITLCESFDTEDLFVFVKAVINCLLSAVKTENIRDDAIGFYFGLITAILDEVVGKESNENETDNSGISDLLPKDSPEVTATKIAVMVLGNDDVLDNFDITDHCPKVKTMMTEEILRFFEFIDVDILTEYTNVLPAYLTKLEKECNNWIISDLEWRAYEILIPYYPEGSLLKRVLDKIFEHCSHFLLDTDDQTQLRDFGVKVFERINNLSNQAVDILQIVNSNSVIGIMDIAIKVQNAEIFACLNKLIASKLFSKDIPKSDFVDLLNAVSVDSVEICRSLVEQNEKLMKKYTSWVKHQEEVDVKLHCPLLVIALQSFVDENKTIPSPLVRVCDRVLEACVNGDADVTDEMCNLALLYLSNVTDNEKVQTIYTSLHHTTSHSPLSTSQMQLLLASYDLLHAASTTKKQDTREFLTSTIQHLSHKSAWQSDEGLRANEICMAKIIPLIKKIKKKAEPEWVEKWPNLVKYSLRHQFENPTIHTLFNTLLPKLYTDGCEPTLSLESLYEMLMSHSMYVGVMLGQKSVEVKDAVITTQLSIVQLNPSLCQPKHLEIFLSAYQATISPTDRKILSLMRFYEAQGVEMSKHRPYLWGAKAQAYYSLHSSEDTPNLNKLPSTHHLIDNIDGIKIMQSAVHFPTCAKIMGEAELSDISDDSVYDPSFLLPLFSHVLASENVVNCHRFIERGCLGYVLTSLSSHDPDLRSVAYICLTRFYSQAEGSKFYERHQILPFIDLLRNSMNTENQRLPWIITAFLRKASLVFLDPGNPMYRPMSKLILGKSTIDLSYLPDFYFLFFGANVNSIKERAWILTVILEGLRDVDDYTILAKKRGFTILQTYYESPLANLESKTLILKVLHSTIKHTGLKLARQGLIEWIRSAAHKCTETVHLELLYTILGEIGLLYPYTTPPQASDDFLPQLRLVVLHELTSPRAGTSLHIFTTLLTTFHAIESNIKSSASKTSTHPKIPLTTTAAAVIVHNYLKVTNDARMSQSTQTVHNICLSLGIDITTDKIVKSHAKNVLLKEENLHKIDDNDIDMSEITVTDATKSSNEPKNTETLAKNVIDVLLKWDAKSDIKNEKTKTSDSKLDCKITLGYLISNIMLQSLNRPSKASTDNDQIEACFTWIRDYTETLPKGVTAQFSRELGTGVVNLLPHILGGEVKSGVLVMVADVLENLSDGKRVYVAGNDLAVCMHSVHKYLQGWEKKIDIVV